MQINKLSATFGKLDGARLELQPGLNVIYAPNESGKSTWCRLIRTMFYGLPTRDRGLTADKNRYAPWSGAAMSGHMELSANGQHYTVVRRTLRAASPMGDFSCTYSGTADPVPGITGENLGEELLGVGREVFVRSAFISQSGLSLDKDAELERRISALVTSGEEEVSFSEVNERLKKQLNRRRHNKTGLIPALETEIAQTTAALDRLHALHRQEEDARIQLAQYDRQAEELQLRLDQWEALEKQNALCAYLQAQQAATTAADYAKTLQEADPALPDAGELARIDGMAHSLDQTLANAELAGELALQRQKEAAAAREQWEQHPLAPATEAQLQERLASIVPRTKKFSPWIILPALAAGGGSGYAAWYFLQQFLLPIAIGTALCCAILFIYNGIRTKKNKAATQSAESQRTQLQAQVDEYLTLLHAYEETHDEAARTAAAARSLHQSCREGLLQLLAQVHPFAPETTNLTNLRAALDHALQKRRRLDEARQNARDTHLHCQLLEQHLPDGPLPDPDAVLPRPTVSYEQVKDALPRAMGSAQAARSQLDTLSGQLRALGDRDALESRLQQQTAQLSRLQAEYDAIAKAMDALNRADQTMQNRFSPELGQRAAEIFGALTDGRYHQVLFDRSFALSTAPSGDSSARDIRLLSQGAADQLYLATRLAICQMVLPAEKHIPLILDDALANFDAKRMAAALEWLLEESKQRQILLFTCHTREQEYLRGREGVNHLAL